MGSADTRDNLEEIALTLPTPQLRHIGEELCASVDGRLRYSSAAFSGLMRALMAETARANDDLSIENDPGNEVLDFLLLLHQRLADVLPEDLEDSDHELMVLRAASRLYERKDGMPEWEQDVADTIRGRLVEYEERRAA